MLRRFRTRVKGGGFVPRRLGFPSHPTLFVFLPKAPRAHLSSKERDWHHTDVDPTFSPALCLYPLAQIALISHAKLDLYENVLALLFQWSSWSSSHLEDMTGTMLWRTPPRSHCPPTWSVHGTIPHHCVMIGTKLPRVLGTTYYVLLTTCLFKMRYSSCGGCYCFCFVHKFFVASYVFLFVLLLLLLLCLVLVVFAGVLRVGVVGFCFVCCCCVFLRFSCCNA